MNAKDLRNVYRFFNLTSIYKMHFTSHENKRIYMYYRLSALDIHLYILSICSKYPGFKAKGYIYFFILYVHHRSFARFASLHKKFYIIFSLQWIFIRISDSIAFLRRFCQKFVWIYIFKVRIFVSPYRHPFISNSSARFRYK